MIHQPDDGLGPRKVFVDGELVDGVVYVNVEEGVVLYNLRPIRINAEHNDIERAERRGRVEVYALIDPMQPRAWAPSYFDWAAQARRGWAANDG